MALQEFLSSNKNRAYPFVENSDTGDLPDWVLLDIRLVNCSAIYNGSLSCTGFSKIKSDVTLMFEYGKDADSTKFTIPVTLGTGITVGVLDVSDTIRVQYAVYGGGTEYVLDTTDGEHRKSISVLPTRVLEISKFGSVASFNGASGRIHIVDGYNTSAEIVENTVYVSAGNGLGLGSDCSVPDDAFDCNKALLFVNGQHADTSGNINIVGGEGVVVQTGRNALVGGSLVPAVTIRHDGSLKGVI